MNVILFVLLVFDFNKCEYFGGVIFLCFVICIYIRKIVMWY